MQLSLSTVPESARLAVLNDVYGPALNMGFETLSDAPLRLDCDITLLPEVSIIRTLNSSMVTHWRKASDANDGFMLNWSPSRGHSVLRHLGREFTSDPGHAILTSAQDPVDCTMLEGSNPLQVRIERSALIAMLPNAEKRLMQPVAADNTALRLLATYVETLCTLAPDRALACSVATHICDLVALALGTTYDATETARQRGMRAARLAAIKRWTIERLDQTGLTVSAAAAAQNVTPRYVQMLFADEESSFSKFVLHERLASVRRHLVHPRYQGRAISDIVFEAGFGDLSYFNRAFRITYGVTPSDIRHQAIDSHR